MEQDNAINTPPSQQIEPVVTLPHLSQSERRAAVLTDLTLNVDARLDHNELVARLLAVTTVAIGDGAFLVLRSEIEEIPHSVHTYTRNPERQQHYDQLFTAYIQSVFHGGLTWKTLVEGQARLIQFSGTLAATIDMTDLWYAEALDITSSVLAPMVVDGVTIGVLGAWSNDPLHLLTDDDLQILVLIAQYGSRAFENHRSYNETHRKLITADTLQDVARALASTINSDHLLTHILDQLRRVVPYDSASIMLREGDEYRVVATQGFEDPEVMLRLHFGQESSVVRRIEQERQPYVIRDTAHRDDENSTSSFDNIKCWMGLPLIIHDTIIGILTIDSYTPDTYNTSLATTAQAVAAHIAIAIHNAQLLQQREQALADLHNAQQRLIQSERLSAVGELVAGVAHELNNPLTTILGFASLLKDTAPTPIVETLDVIQDAAVRARHIVQNLLAFARQQQATMERVQLNEVVEKVVRLREQQLLDEGVILEVKLDALLPPILADGLALQQVLLNLLNNAAQALEGWQGKRTITIRSTYSSGLDPRVMLTVDDSGPGIAPEHRTRIFDPFFTTKPLGEGTGLGLSICYGIIQQHGGEIRVAPSPQGGARFMIDLPLRQLPEQPVEFVDPVEDEPEVTHKRMLVVEDEPAINALIVRILQRHGYDADSAHDGADALKYIASATYDLIICDIKMPNLNGMQFYRILEQQAPHLAHRTIFVSGDTISNDTYAFLQHTGNLYLEKPFDPKDLITLVQRISAT